MQVAPYVGAWIETKGTCSRWSQSRVAPYVGAWIETKYGQTALFITLVAPYVGAWIETLRDGRRQSSRLRSHPMWVRGLKQFFVLTVQSYKPKPRNIVLASNIPI